MTGRGRRAGMFGAVKVCLSRQLWLVGSLLAASLFCGCSSFRTELGKPLKVEPEAFVEGQTRAETVIHELGPPNRASRTADGFAFLYEHSVMREFQLGIAIPLPV